MSDANIKQWESDIGDLENEAGSIMCMIDDLELQLDDLRRRKNSIPYEINEIQQKVDIEPFDEPV